MTTTYNELLRQRDLLWAAVTEIRLLTLQAASAESPEKTLFRIYQLTDEILRQAELPREIGGIAVPLT